MLHYSAKYQSNILPRKLLLFATQFSAVIIKTKIWLNRANFITVMNTFHRFFDVDLRKLALGGNDVNFKLSSKLKDAFRAERNSFEEILRAEQAQVCINLIISLDGLFLSIKYRLSLSIKYRLFLSIKYRLFLSIKYRLDKVKDFH